MFTGLVQDVGVLTQFDRTHRGARMTIDSRLAGAVSGGDSIAVNGVCLTATAAGERSFASDAMNETLAHTSLTGLEIGSEVNLELPLRLSDRLGGHLVQGHVDGVGAVVALAEDGFARRVKIAAEPDLLRYLVAKGSIAVDGVSLTVAEIDARSFTLSLIPETLERTNLRRARPGTRVNLEVDMLAKYVERVLRNEHD